MKTTNILAPIKWTGNKRTQSKRIIGQMSDYIPCYCELFLGSGAVLMDLLTNHSNKLIDEYGNKSRIIVSDTNPDLIAMWRKIKDNPMHISHYYRTEWISRNTIDGVLSPNDCSPKAVEHRNKHYYALRDKYNKNVFSGNEEQGMLLMCLLAFNFNGLVRYGKHGFNASNMPVTSGMHPDTKFDIIKNCNKLLNEYNVEIHCSSYDEINIPVFSTVYLDPPYKMFLNDKSENGVYNCGNFNLDEFSEWCHKTNYCNLMISFDGGEVGEQYFPLNEYIKIVNENGISNFRKQMTKTREPKKRVKSSESLYLKPAKPSKLIMSDNNIPTTTITINYNN